MMSGGPRSVNFGCACRAPTLGQTADQRQLLLPFTTVIGVLGERHPGEFDGSQMRTLQRRMRDWRAVHGPEKETFVAGSV